MSDKRDYVAYGLTHVGGSGGGRKEPSTPPPARSKVRAKSFPLSWRWVRAEK